MWGGNCSGGEADDRGQKEETARYCPDWRLSRLRLAVLDRTCFIHKLRRQRIRVGRLQQSVSQRGRDREEQRTPSVTVTTTTTTMTTAHLRSL